MVTDSWEGIGPGEPVAVVALSGPVDPERLKAGLEVIRGWGNPVLEAPNLDARAGYLAGTDQQRLEGLEWALDQGVRWILAARGGYGSTRLMNDLPWSQLAESKTRLVGFSDLTAVINPLVKIGGAAQVHGPMVASGLDRPANADRLLQVLRGDLIGKTLFRFGASRIARSGAASGVAMGGNLTLLAALAGTPHALDLTGAVLFLEEVREPLYSLDRLLTQLRASASLTGVKALISGGLHGCRPAAERSERWRHLLIEAVPEDVPVVTDLPFGHGAANMAFPIGVPVEVDTSRRFVRWSS